MNLLCDSYEPQWKYDVDDDAYHTDREHVSSSLLKTILKSPASFRGHFNNEWPKKDTDPMIFGRAAHCAVLEGDKFWKRYKVMPPFGDLRFKDNKLKKEAWFAELAPTDRAISSDDFDKLQGIVEAIISHPDAFGLLKNGSREASGYYRDPETGIRCRIRPDFISNDVQWVVDLKTVQDCTIERFSKKVYDMRWDFSLAMYAAGAEAITGIKPPYQAFIAVEKEPPYECAVYHPDPAFVELGERDYRKALRLLKECLQKGHFPRYQERVQTIAPPLWALKGEWLP